MKFFRTRKRRLLASSALSCLTLGGVLFATPAASSADSIDHSLFASLLQRYVENGRVDYQAWSRSPAQLDRYLSSLSRVKRRRFLALPESEQIAFWINAYNAHTIRLILRHYPVGGIHEVSPLWKRALGGSPFGIKLAPLGHLAPQPRSDDLSLDDIEHGILRPHFREALVHFALVCASKSCPSLASQAYTGAGLKQRLSAAARGFLRDRSKNRYDAGQHRLYLSAIFSWFREDFEREGPLQDYVRRYLPEQDVALLARQDRAPDIEFLDYDWSLNEAENK